MSMVTNTLNRYDGYRAVREDLANVIYNISPVDTPCMSNFGRENVKNTYFEWQTDQLAAAVTTNAQLEGDDVNGVTDARTPTNRVGNYTQISRAVIEASGTVEAVDKAGMKSYLAYELAKAASELKRHMEATITSNQIAVAGGTTTARKTAALGAWITTNSTQASGGTAPAMSSGSDGYPNTYRITTTGEAFTLAMLKTLQQDTWTQGGKANTLYVGPHNKAVVSGFTGIATLFRDVAPGKQAAIVGAADIFVGDFGQISVVPNRFQPEANAYLIDNEYWSLAYLRNFRTEVLAKTGDAEKRMIIVEYGLKSRQQRSSAVKADCATS